MSYPNFTAEDFAKWNETTSCFRLPKRLIGKDAVKDVRVALIEAIGAERVCAVQALPDQKYRIEFTSPSYKMDYDLNGLNFRGVNITPTPAYEHLKNVFVDTAPLHMPNDYISSSLSAYGRVVNVQDLRVRGFKDIRTETCMVTMSVLKPIPVVVKIANFPCSQVSRNIALHAIPLGILPAVASSATRKPQGRPYHRLVRLFNAHSPWRQFHLRPHPLLCQQLPLLWIPPLFPSHPSGWKLTVARALLFLLFLLRMPFRPHR
jgi:hypothetical protein